MQVLHHCLLSPTYAPKEVPESSEQGLCGNVPLVRARMLEDASFAYSEVVGLEVGV